MFNFKKSLDGSFPMPHEMMAGGGTYHVGTALCVTSGILEIATGSKLVTHIAYEEKTLAANGMLTVIDVTPGMLFEVPISAYSSTYTKNGLRVTLHTDGEQVTATAVAAQYGSSASGSYTGATVVTTNVGAYIYDTCGASAQGDKITVRLGYAS